jgi:hypothetical protein
VDEGDNVSLDGSASIDPDGQIESFQWRQVSGPGVGMAGGDTPSPSFTAPNLTTAADADLIFELTVTDDDGLTASDRVTVTVAWTNDAPTARAGADRSVAEGTIVNLDGRNSEDPEGESLSYRWEKISGPEITLVDASAPRASFTAPNLTTAADAELVFELRVTDAHGASDTDRVRITVTWENDAPTANAGSDRTVEEGAAVRLDAGASTDPEGQIDRFEWRRLGGPEITLEDADTQQPSFTAPNLTTPADTELIFELTVTDAHGASDTDQVAITIRWENDAPTAVAGEDQHVEAGDTVILDGMASGDPDDGISSYTWNQVVGPQVQLSATDESQTTFTAPANGETAPLHLSFELLVSDAGGLHATDSVDIWVDPESTSSGEEPQKPTDPQTPDNPSDSQDPGDDTSPTDDTRDSAEPGAESSGGGGGGCFLSISQGRH